MTTKTRLEQTLKTRDALGKIGDKLWDLSNEAWNLALQDEAAVHLADDLRKFATEFLLRLDEERRELEKEALELQSEV